jgi:N-acetyl-gamma-glutamyl-phosphate reductase
MTRGILATVYVKLPSEGLAERYAEFYSQEPFVRVLAEDLPATKSVSGTNFCHLAVRPSGHPDYSIVLSAIDNLGKGAAGTAVHNMNILFGFPETEGLRCPAVGP